MGIVKEPHGVNLMVNGSALTPSDLLKIDEAISQYKATQKHKKTDLRRKNKSIIKK